MRCFFARALLAASMLLPALGVAAEVNVYSARQEALIKPLLDRYTAETGVKVNLVTGDADPLLQRLRAEGDNSPADVLLTVDVARLIRAKELGVLQRVQSAVLDQAIPETYRDPDGQWYGLSLRARVVVYAKDRVDPAELSTYAGLADPKWKGRICVRSSQSTYNQGLVAALIAHLGAARTEAWARDLVANLARPPQGGDRDQVKAVASGQCDLAIVNTYYLGGMLASDQAAERDAAAKVAVFWPDQAGDGAHVNVSGAGVTRAARNRDEAVKLLEFLAGEAAQSWYAEANNEYPVRPGVAMSEALRGFGEFRADALPLSQLGALSAEAVLLMDRAGWK